MSMSKHNSSGCLDLTAHEALKNTKCKYLPTESEEQIALFEWAELHEKIYPELKLLHHIPNGGLRNGKTAAKLKREGVKAGVPDICLPAARQGFQGLYIELKRMNGRIAKSQQEWLNELKKNGYFAVVAYGFEEAKGFIEWYLKCN